MFPYHPEFLSKLVYTGLAAVWGVPLPGWDPTLVSLPPLPYRGSDDWHSANSYQRLPNNGARALMNVIVMLDLHNIWKPPCQDLPQSLSPVKYSKYFPLLGCSLSYTGA